MCMFILGKLYYEDIPINRYINIQKSIYYLSQSAASNHLKSQFLLGKIYYEGKYIARNMNLSIYYFTQASKQNDPDSQYYLGMIYYEGIFVPRDINKSIHYLELSVNQNDINAQNNLGIIYYEDNYIPRNIVKSIYYFTLAASNGDNVAQHNLGKIYYERIYVERDIDKAIHFFYLSAKKNNPTALYNLGVIYYEGIYCLRDIDKAIYFLEKSSKLNFSLAQYQLGLILLNERSVQNLNRGIIYIRLSAENHNHEAEVILGDLFFEGKYFEYDLEKAIHFYKEASCFYNQYAKNNLGVIYKNGFDRIEKNIPLAKEYFNEAIKQKHDAISMYNLANILIEEEDFKTEKTESIKLLIDSASQGFGPSTKLLCFVFIQKFSQIDFEIINNELQKYGNKSNKFVTYILQNCQKIQLLMSNKMFFLKKEYDNLRESNYVYLIKNIKKLDEMKKDRYLYIKAKAKIKEINELFYEGLGNLTL
ncbi:hypothetical protein M9Y10_045531 [Tritrichomonas musculus]|uniref:Uncharacterized protein n=1 Tax=Tritrichomonas musculus TaxID=1915356 RepID=A0ABR2JXB7_9EUKA